MNTTTIRHRELEMEMTSATSDDEIRQFVGDGHDAFERIDADAIAEKAWRVSEAGGYRPGDGSLLTDADEIEAYLLAAARERVQDEIDDLVAGLIAARDAVFGDGYDDDEPVLGALVLPPLRRPAR